MQGRPPGETGNLKKEIAEFTIQTSGMTLFGTQQPPENRHAIPTSSLSDLSLGEAYPRCMSDNFHRCAEGKSPERYF